MLRVSWLANVTHNTYMKESPALLEAAASSWQETAAVKEY